MQRVLVILVVILLVTASLAAGALAANWPFWSRAWQWHVADGGVPSIAKGPRAIVRGGGATPLRFDSADSDLAAFASAAGSTTLLMRMREGRAEAWHASRASGDDVAHGPLDGRGLGVLLLEPVYAALARRHPGVLDRPVGAWLDTWRQDARGAHTPRELLALVAAGIEAAPATKPLNPFRTTAQLASGPDFHAAALALFESGDGGGREARVRLATQQAAAAQLLAGIAAAVEQQPFEDVLATLFWSGTAHGDASLLLDRRRGNAALHCCLAALPADWLRVAQWLGTSELGPGAGMTRIFRTSGRALVVRGDQALLWVGEGPTPSGLETLLQPDPAPASR